MEVAEEACKNDKRCDGLLSQKCEIDGDYHICFNNGTIEYGDTISSCVYEKQIRGIHGIFFNIYPSESNLINLNMCKYISYNSINIIINFGIIVFITNVARQYLYTLHHKEP